MEPVSAESNAHFIAFRRLVYSLSQQLSKQETQALTYIRLYKYKEKYKDATALEVFAKLETDGVFSPRHPDGLVEVAKDLKRQDLVSEVKEFIKKRTKKTSSLTRNRQSRPNEIEWDNEEDLHLKATFEVTLAQATVLMQQVEILEHALAGGKEQRQRAEEAIREAGQTAGTLAERLRRAQREMELGTSSPSQGDSMSDGDSPIDPQQHLMNARMSALSQQIPKTAPPQLNTRHSLPAFSLQHQAPYLTWQPQQCTSRGEVLKEGAKDKEEEEEEDDPEDDYERMWPAQTSALESVSSLQTSNHPIPTARSKRHTSPPALSSFSPSVIYSPKDGTVVGRRSVSGMYYDQRTATGQTRTVNQTSEVQGNQRQPDVPKRTFSVASTQRHSASVAHGAVLTKPTAIPSERTTPSPSKVDNSKRKKPVIPPKPKPLYEQHLHGRSETTVRSASVSSEDPTHNDPDDGYTTLHPVRDTTGSNSDNGLEDLRNLRKFIETDPVLKGSGGAHYYKHLQREDIEYDPYTALNYGEQDP